MADGELVFLDHMHGVPYGSLVDVEEPGTHGLASRYVPVQDLRRGDHVRTGGDEWARVLSLVATEVPAGVVGLCRVGGARVAPRQVVHYGGAWIMPCAYVPPVLERCGCLLQVVLEPPACTLVVDGVACKSLGVHHSSLSARADTVVELHVLRAALHHADAQHSDLVLSGFVEG